MMQVDNPITNAAKPGAVWLTSGFRGGGKTHTAVAVAEYMVKGRFPGLGRVVVVTNIIFFHKVKGRLTEGTPDGVYHIHTMKELFPIVVEVIGRYGRDVLILLILDEAQNFIGGDSNQSNASVMMKELLGIIRKFRMMVWFLTPSARSVGPAFRCFLNDPKYPGNLTAKFRKDLGFNKRYIETMHINRKPEEFIGFLNYDMDKPVLIRVPVTEWTKKKEDLRNGEYCYDHEASATFYVGDGFDWGLFNRTVGGVSSIRVLDTIKMFYEKHVAEGNGNAEESNATKEYKLGVIHRAMDRGIDVKAASSIAGVPYSTARRWLKDEIRESVFDRGMTEIMEKSE